MRRRLLSVGLALVAGCAHDPKTTVIQPGQPGPASGSVVQVGHVSPATEGTAVRVASLGRKIVDANPQVGLKPTFQCIGVAQPAVFHRLGKDACDVWITEGLVNQCQGEGQLAAVLCQELGKAASEKAALNPPPARVSIEPPPEVPVGNDVHGSTLSPDMTRFAELAKVDQERRRREQPPPPPPPPEVLARAFLLRAGYAATDLQAVVPLLRAADQNTDIEKQLTGKLH
jgi:hypothetical protein